MRILMVSEDLPGAQVGGLGKHVVTLANRLLADGHEVEILGRNDRGAHGCAEQIGFHGRFRPGFDQPHPGWKEAQLGIFNPLKRPYFARKIGRAIARHAHGFDVVHYHGHLPMTGLYVPDGINYVQTRHDQGSECLTHLRFRDDAVCDNLVPGECAACIRRNAGPLRKSVTAIAVNGYRDQNARAFARHKTVFVSDFLRRQFLRAVPDADLTRCRVIHNVVDYPRLRAAALAAPPPRRGDLLLVGRIDAGKGFGEFLDAARGRLAPHVRITVVGDGPQRAALEGRHGGGQVRFFGWQDYPATLALAARAHLCVVPSVCAEACSTTVLEALALGRPCLALARGGTPELARYAGFPDQLGLADSMADLVALAARRLDEQPHSRPPPPTFGADAGVLLSRLLALYAEPTDHCAAGGRDKPDEDDNHGKRGERAEQRELRENAEHGEHNGSIGRSSHADRSGRAPNGEPGTQSSNDSRRGHASSDRAANHADLLDRHLHLEQRRHPR
ncbi:glycosyltransferase family 4 protein [Massilia sp.]|uniref:glycosyltransferase family 4 protein n=1 Tax=Massilia sp. TaxID=1882437 RepID=UPI0028A1A3B7|nr:glycosyltransferase family 4 protein [Massilia sp.]